MGPFAPVLLTGPSSMVTFIDDKKSTTPDMELTVALSSKMKHKSSDPGSGFLAQGWNSFPCWCKLIFIVPNLSAYRVDWGSEGGLKVSTFMPKTLE